MIHKNNQSFIPISIITFLQTKRQIAMTKIGFKYSETRKVESKIRELVR